MKVDEDLVYIERLTKEHVSAYLAMFSPLVRSLLHATSLMSEYQYIAESIAQNSFFYAIFFQQTSALIGAIQIRDSACSGQLYCWLHEQYWGTGIFQHAMRAVARLYFNQTTDLYFNARVDVMNVRSYKALRNLGFAPIRIVNGPYGKQYELILRKK